VVLVALWFAGESTSAQTKGLIGTLRGEQAAPEIDELEGTWNVVESRQGGRVLQQAALSQFAFVAGRFHMKEGADVWKGSLPSTRPSFPNNSCSVRSIRGAGETVSPHGLHSERRPAGAVLRSATGRDGPGRPWRRRRATGGFLVTLQSLLVRRFQGHTGRCTGSASPRMVKWAVSGSGWPWGDRTIRLWDIATGRETRGISTASVPEKPNGCNRREVSGEVLGLALSPDATQILAGGCGGFLGLWDTQSGALTRQLEGHEKTVTSVAISPDGRRALSGGCDNWSAYGTSPAERNCGG